MSYSPPCSFSSPLFLGSTHTSAADFHLTQLSRLLLPTLTTRVCMHAVLQAGTGGGSDVGQAVGGSRIEHEAAAALPPPRPGGDCAAAAADTTAAGNDGPAAAAGAPSSAAAGAAPTGSGRGGRAAAASGAGGGEVSAAGLDAVAAQAATAGEGVGNGKRASVAGEEGAGAAVAAEGGGAAEVDMWSSLVDVLEVSVECGVGVGLQLGKAAVVLRCSSVADELDGLIAGNAKASSLKSAEGASCLEYFQVFGIPST